MVATPERQTLYPLTPLPADNQYDHGPIILQKAVPVLEDDTPDALAARVFEAECEAYPEALRLIATGRVTLEGRRVRIGKK